MAGWKDTFTFCKYLFNLFWHFCLFPIKSLKKQLKSRIYSFWSKRRPKDIKQSSIGQEITKRPVNSHKLQPYIGFHKQNLTEQRFNNLVKFFWENSQQNQPIIDPKISEL